MGIRQMNDHGRIVTFRPEDLLIDLQHAVLDGELTRGQAIEQARFGLPGISWEMIDTWFPEDWT